MKFFITILSLFLFLTCNDVATDAQQSTVISKSEVKKTSLHPPSPTAISIDTTITLDFLMGKFKPSTHPDFVVIDKKYASRKGMFLQKKTYEAFKKMHAAAKKDGINLTIKSATRNFFSQKKIWDSKWLGTKKVTGVKNIKKEFPQPKARALKILEFSSMPSTSRHHWGTDIDMNNFTNKYFEHGQGKKEYDWLKNNAHLFGFYQPYTPKGTARKYGYNEEKWHWSFLPLSKKYIDQMKLRMKDENIKGFQGAAVAKEIGVVEKYILGINQECL